MTHSELEFTVKPARTTARSKKINEGKYQTHNTHSSHGESGPAPLRIGNREMSRGELSRATGIAMSHVSKIFNGIKAPGMYTAKLIATAFGATLDEVYEMLSLIKRPKPRSKEK